MSPKSKKKAYNGQRVANSKKKLLPWCPKEDFGRMIFQKKIP